MPDFSKTYSQLVIQPIDLIYTFNVDFCFASVIKWLTKWHMDGRKNEHLSKAKYYLDLCGYTKPSKELYFAIRLYCMINGFITKEQKRCLLERVSYELLVSSNMDNAKKLLANQVCE